MDLFDFGVIDGHACHLNHFSKFFIFNAKALKGYNKIKFMGMDDSNHPFILYANFMSDSGWHSAENVARKLHKFLNKYSLEHKVFTTRGCNKISLPVLKIGVPSQLNGWACGYECPVTLCHVMKKLKDRQKIHCKM